MSIKKAIKTKKWKWINRGFLNGPMLPIYGFAAIVILLSTIPFKDSVVEIFLLGMTAATILELVTGTIMEKLFRVKYWDYSELPLNYKGHICLIISLFWGFLSVFMIKVIHVPAESVIIRLPDIICKVLAFCLAGTFAFDFSTSFREAWDVREILEKLEESKEVLAQLHERLDARVDAVIAFAPTPDMEEIRKKGKNAKAELLYRLDEFRKKRVAEIEYYKEKLRLDEETESLETEKLHIRLEQQICSIFSHTNNQYLRVIRHLKRNPGAISRKYESALREIKELFVDKE